MKKKDYLVIMLISIAITSLATGIFYIVPETYRPYYALIAAIIFMMDILCFPFLKNGMVSDDEKRAYPFWILLGLFIIFESLFFLFFDSSPKNAKSWLFPLFLYQVSLQLLFYINIYETVSSLPNRDY